MLNDAQIRESLNQMIIDVLAVEPEELRPDARFFDDLGGESIDILELSFHCERRFGTKVQFQSMLNMQSPETDATGRLTTAAINRIAQQLPYIDIEPLRKNPKLDQLQQLITVENLFQFLRHVLRQAANGNEVAGEPNPGIGYSGA